jgi:hypothetical protein
MILLSIFLLWVFHLSLSLEPNISVNRYKGRERMMLFHRDQGSFIQEQTFEG